MQGCTWLPSELGAGLGYMKPYLIKLLLPEDQRGRRHSKATSTPYASCVTGADPLPFTQQTSHRPSHFLNKGKRSAVFFRLRPHFQKRWPPLDFRFPLICPIWNSHRANQNGHSMLSFIAMSVDTVSQA